ncbi:MAG: hypothetical protein FJ147_07950 [Deltaproteobacteria bacterium]|nr:hypothetical protein [Deltaproteobacteria bacterium]
MANSTADGLSRKVAGAKGKLLKRSENSVRAAEASLAAIQQTGWTPEAEAALLDAPSLGQIQPEFLDHIVKEAGERRDPNLWRLLAGLCERRNEDQRAILYANEALQIQPNDVAAMGLLARLWEKSHADTEAVNWYQRLIAIEPTHVGANRFFALLHYHRREYETVLVHLTRLVEAEPKVHIHRLYVLLAKVKSAGIHGLAQPLTEVRRWRNFTPEEVLLAHELFVLVGTQCLQAKQRARAKQYFTRALQLVPSVEVESLLAQVSDQPTPLTPKIKVSVTTPFPVVSVPQERRPMPSLPPIVLSGRHGTENKYGLFTSGLGLITAAAVVALFGLWSLQSNPERRMVIELEDEDEAFAEEVQESVSARAKMIPSSSIVIDPQQQVAKAPSSPDLPLSTTKEIPVQQGTRKADLPAPPTKPAGNPPPSSPSLAAEKSTAQPAQPAQPPATAAVASLERDSIPVPPLPSVTPPQPVVKKEVPKPALPASSPEKTTATPANNLLNKKEKVTAVTPTPPPTDTVPTPIPPTPVVHEKTPETNAPLTEKREALASSDSESVVSTDTPDTTVEKSESVTTPAEPPTIIPLTAATNASPATEGNSVEELAVVTGTPESTTITTLPADTVPVPSPGALEVSAPAAPPTETVLPTESTGPTESIGTEGHAPAPVAGEEKTIAIAITEAPLISLAVEAPPLFTADAPLKEEEQEVRESESTSTRTVASVSGAIARLSSQVPQAAQFPTRERLVSVPPEQLLPTMKELMKRETGAASVATPARGVLRARVSGKRPVGERATKMYGQYIVEVLPGPTEGTSRVRAKALMFDWRTGQPMGNAEALADRLLKKVEE